MESPSKSGDLKVVGNRLVVCHSEAVVYLKPLGGAIEITLKIVDLVVFLHSR